MRCACMVNTIVSSYLSITIAIALAAVSCAGVRPEPVAAPSTLPAEYISVAPGYVASEPGFFLSIPGAIAELTLQSDHDLEIQKQLAIMIAERRADAKQMARDEWCAKYCLWIGATAGLVLGGFAGFGIHALAH